MAGKFEGLSDLERQPFADIFPPEPTQRGRGLPPTPLAPGGEYRTLCPDYRLPLVRPPARAPMGFEERGPSVAPALARRWHPGRQASPPLGS